MKHSDGKSVFHNDKTPIQRAWGVTEQSDDYENDGLLNHQISTQLSNPLWEILDQCVTQPSYSRVEWMEHQTIFGEKVSDPFSRVLLI